MADSNYFQEGRRRSGPSFPLCVVGPRCLVASIPLARSCGYQQYGVQKPAVCSATYLIVPAYPCSPGQRAVKQLLFLFLLFSDC